MRARVVEADRFAEVAIVREKNCARKEVTEKSKAHDLACCYSLSIMLLYNLEKRLTVTREKNPIKA